MPDETTKLYRITFTGRLAPVYVVSTDPTSAYQRVRADLDARDYGFFSERALRAIELVAEDAIYLSNGTRLYA